MTLKELWQTPGIRTLLLCAAATTCFTLGLFFYSLTTHEDRVVGTVVVVTGNVITIEEPRGERLSLIITPETKTKALGPLTTLTPGTLVMASGERTSTSTLTAFGIRRVDERRPLPLP